MREILLAENSGFCFGVKRAIDEAIKHQKEEGKRIYTLGPLIHNNDAVKYLEENEIYAVSLDEVDKLKSGEVILIRSHGVSEAVLNKLKECGLKVVDATCPYVTNIQKKARKYKDEGYSIIIMGDKDHPEVIGINGWCYDSAIISKKGELPDTLPRKVCVVSQTTEKQENWNKTLAKVTSMSKEILAFNTICSATEVRQKSADELSKEVDAMIVVGGKNSSNTTKLYEICKHNCEKTIHIENIKELDKAFLEDESIKKVGVTAGASTPDWIIQEVLEYIKE